MAFCLFTRGYSPHRSMGETNPSKSQATEIKSNVLAALAQRARADPMSKAAAKPAVRGLKKRGDFRPQMLEKTGNTDGTWPFYMQKNMQHIKQLGFCCLFLSITRLEFLSTIGKLGCDRRRPLWVSLLGGLVINAFYPVHA